MAGNLESISRKVSKNDRIRPRIVEASLKSAAVGAAYGESSGREGLCLTTHVHNLIRRHLAPTVSFFARFGWNRIAELWNPCTLRGKIDTSAMKTTLRRALFVFLLLPLAAFAQGARTGADFQITKITKNLIATPQFTYGGAEQYQTNQRDRWLEVEVQFTATPQFTDELTFKYYILFNSNLLTGEVTHVNIPAGRENRSVMYVCPRALVRFGNNRPITTNSCQNIAVQIVQQGAVKDESSLSRAQPRWYATLPQVPGFVLNKNETPFAPLYWDRYEQIKTGR